MMASRTLSVSINASPERVYAFIADPRHLPEWATTFCRSIRRSKHGWVIETPQGPMGIRIAGKNSLGVLDHAVTPAHGPAVYVPMRVVPNARGSEALFTLFRSPGMSAERFARDVSLVKRDLATLKRVMERP